MTPFETKSLPAEPTVTAPDGSDVRVLVSLPSGSLAHFQLAPGRTSAAVRHRTVAELWYILSGTGEMWCSQEGQEQIVPLHAGVSLTIPLGVSFQFRATGSEPLSIVGVTIPPWPGPDEAVLATGPWTAT